MTCNWEDQITTYQECSKNSIFKHQILARRVKLVESNINRVSTRLNALILCHLQLAESRQEEMNNIPRLCMTVDDVLNPDEFM